LKAAAGTFITADPKTQKPQFSTARRPFGCAKKAALWAAFGDCMRLIT
jgi:hypothetical protein